ncbi:MAG: selenocysteine-specific translation elongation factor, partial [Oscillospiraceae bacterium]
MKHVIIGTAGHVDHGKTSLIKAITGINADRLKEEQKRGITIELGFAHIDLGDDISAGIVDVPGHEAFIKNMLMGAGGIDLAMLIVAADEGFMPQTIEHLEILTLLGIKKGVVVITKTDLAEPEFVEMVREDVKEHTKGTFLENCPIVAVSAYTGENIELLKTTLKALIYEVEDKNSHSPFRLPIDRVFSIEGFGTVVTGTLTDGRVNVGDEITVYPQSLVTKVRNLQVHSNDVKTAYAGQRVAVNLANIKRTELAKGSVIAATGSVKCSYMLD